MKGKQYYIFVKNIKINVSEKIYKEYHKQTNHEIYEEKQYKKHTVSIAFDLGSDGFEEQLMNALAIKELFAALDKLDGTEKRIIKALFFENMSERALANELDMSQSMINKIKKIALFKLKNMIYFKTRM